MSQSDALARSGDQDGPPVRGLPAPGPSFGGPGQRQGFPIRGEPPGRSVGKDRVQRGGLLAVAESVVGVTKDGQGSAAQPGRPQAGPRAG